MEKVRDFCPDCGALVWEGDVEYVSQYPNGSDMAREEAMRRHHSGDCPASSEWDYVEVCPACGEEVGRWDAEYAYRYPNGLDMAVSEAYKFHNRICPGE